MKNLLVFLFLAMSFCLSAHEGHGEAPKDPTRFGGQLSNVVDANKMEKKDKNNPPLFKSELIRSEDGTLRFYIFDLKMKNIELSSFPEKLSAKIENAKNKINLSFDVQKEGDHYIGKMPKISKKPFNLFFKFKKSDQDLFAGYDNLD